MLVPSLLQMGSGPLSAHLLGDTPQNSTKDAPMMPPFGKLPTPSELEVLYKVMVILMLTHSKTRNSFVLTVEEFFDKVKPPDKLGRFQVQQEGNGAIH